MILTYIKIHGAHFKVSEQTFPIGCCVFLNPIRENKFKVLCEKHVSQCTHLCVDDAFLCMYCLKRDPDHEKHSKTTVESEVALIKEALLNVSTNKDNIDQFLKATKESICLMRRKLEDLLQVRKEECLSRYKDYLNEQEVILRSELRSICDDHLKQYLHMTPEYYQGQLEKCDAELAIEKNTFNPRLQKKD